jgi:hypothetical protein
MKETISRFVTVRSILFRAEVPSVSR